MSDKDEIAKTLEQLKSVNTIRSVPPGLDPSISKTETAESGTTETEVPKADKIEEFAKSKGHMSLEEWAAAGKDPDLYIPAEDWARNYSWISYQKKLEKQLKDQKEAIDYLIEQNKRAESHGRKQALEELKKAQIAAIATGDPDKITAATEKLLNEKKSLKPSVVDSLPPGTDPEVRAFVEKNQSWFNDDTPMNVAAKSYAVSKESALAKEKPYLSVTERFAIVENEVKEMFFKNAKVDAVQKTATSTEPKSSKKVEDDYSDLSDEHQHMIKLLSKTTKNFDVKKYVDQVRAIGKSAHVRGAILRS